MRTLIFYFLLSAVGVYLATPLVDPDLWWHIVSGRLILNNNSVPTIDYWSMFSAGEPWRAYSWLIELVIAVVEKFAGLDGILVLQILLCVGYVVVVGFVFRSIIGREEEALFLAIICSVGTFAHISLRPQTFTWIYLALILLITDKIKSGSLGIKQMFWLGLIMTFWGNTHLSSIFGLTAIFLLTLDPKNNPGRGLKCSLVGFLGTLITPYFGGEWLTFLQKTTHPFSFKIIAEFQPAVITEYPTAFLILLWVFFAIQTRFRQLSVSLGDLTLAVIFSLIGVMVVKFLPLAFIAVGYLIAREFKAYKIKSTAEIPANLEIGLSKFFEGIKILPAQGSLFIVACLIIVKTYQLINSPVNTAQVPVAEFDFIVENKLPLPVLVPFGQGGYQIYRFTDGGGKLLSEKHAVAIDGRTNLIKKEVWEEFLTALQGLKGWQKFIERVSPKTIVWRNNSPLPSLLIASGDWCVVFEGNSEIERQKRTTDRFMVLMKKEEVVVDDQKIKCQT
ncbi:MAG TPA: hypothetical protein PKD37_08010 [Oligoflexia bacterium]|nr:hypothetical protein [Oligoflexia bacterium]HMP27907.1 hypothetical protein [Oligoflexia bacterium]